MSNPLESDDVIWLPDPDIEWIENEPDCILINPSRTSQNNSRPGVARNRVFRRSRPTVSEKINNGLVNSRNAGNRSDLIGSSPDESHQSQSSNKSIPNYHLSCLICFEEFQNEHSGSIYSTKRGHLYCKNCIHTLMRQTKQCGLCRTKLTKNSFHPIYF